MAPQYGLPFAAVQASLHRRFLWQIRADRHAIEHPI